MKEKERELMKRFVRMPQAVKERLLDHLEGAAMALDVMDRQSAEAKSKDEE